MAIQIGADDTTYVAAVKGRDVRIYSITEDAGGEFSCEARTIDFMASGVDMKMDAAGRFHLVYTDLWNDALKYASDESGTWVIETVDSIGAFHQFPDDHIDQAHASIALSAEGEPHLAYVERDNADIRYAAKSGGTWSVETIIAEGDWGKHTSIAVAPDGSAHVAAMTIQYFTASYLGYATNRGGTWTTEFPSGSILRPSIAIGIDGEPRMALLRNFLLQYGTHTPSGWTFSPMGGVLGEGWDPYLVIDENGFSHVADWAGNDVIPSPVGATYFTNASGTWHRELASLNEEEWTENAAIALDANGEPRVVYYSDDGFAAIYVQRESGAWKQATLDSGLFNLAWMDIDGENLHHAIIGDQAGDRYVYATRGENSLDWSFELITDDYGVGLWSDFDLDVNGIAHLVIDVFGITYVTNESGAWTATPINDDADHPRISCNATGRCAVTFFGYDAPGVHVGEQDDGGDWFFEWVDPMGADVGDIFYDDDGSIYLTYSQSNAVLYATNDEGTWRFDVIDATLPVTDKGYESIFVDSDGIVHVLYQNDFGVRYATNADGAWEWTDLDADARYVSVTLTGTGFIGAAVGDYENAEIAVYFFNGIGWERSFIDRARTMQSAKFDKNGNFFEVHGDSGAAYESIIP
ncbi:hypothetical protein K8I61_12580 [bacterium]|nr:hypothetical protein [bacterium]